jgi:hypothetical protein
MATQLSTIISRARVTLLETTAVFWTDAELLAYANAGIKDLWKGVMDLYQGHIVTIDESNVSIAANSSTLTGVPTDVFRVEKLQPRTLNADNMGLVFKYRRIIDPDFVQAEALPPVQARYNTIYYAILNAGAPVGAPTIRIAPQLQTDVSLSLTYTPTIADLASNANNPIPGESDEAIKDFIIAWARAKERPDGMPDPEYISLYATEKTNLKIALTPRSVQEPDYVMGMWEPPAAGVTTVDWP